MPVSLFLTDAQIDVFNAAMKGKTIDFKTVGRGNVQLTAENWQAIRDAINELHQSKVKIRTKTAENMEAAYYAQQLLEKFGYLESDLKRLPSANDNATLVEVETTDEVPAPVTEEETKPVLDDKWFEEAEKINPKKDKKN
jgi:hypothetical protein